MPAPGTSVKVTSTAAIATATIPSVTVSGLNTAMHVAGGNSAGAGGRSVNSVSFNGSSAGFVEDMDFVTGGYGIASYHKIAPAAVTANVIVTYSAAPDELIVGATPLTDVDQTTPVGTENHATGSASTAAVVITAALGDLVVDVEYNDSSSSTLTKAAAQTLLWQDAVLSLRGGSSLKIAATLTPTMSWTLGVVCTYLIGGIAYKAPVAVGAQPAFQLDQILPAVQQRMM